MGRAKRTVRPGRRAAPAAATDAEQSAALLRQLASVSLSNVQPEDEPEPHSADEASPATDSDAPRRPRKQRKRVGKYNKPLTEQERLDILRLHVNERKTAKDISALYLSRGVTVPESTRYSINRRMDQGRPLMPAPRHRTTKYTAEDAAFVVRMQDEHNFWHYNELRRAWQEHFGRTDKLSNDTIHKMLKAAGHTAKRLVPVPVARNLPINIEDRFHYSQRAIGWERDTLIFIDETTFSKGLRRTRGRSRRGTIATIPTLNSSGVGIKVCAAVSPVVGLVMWDTQFTAYTGADFARFMQSPSTCLSEPRPAVPRDISASPLAFLVKKWRRPILGKSAA